MKEPLGGTEEGGGGAEEAEEAKGAGGVGGFFLKKLNINEHNRHQ
jgi:hypothetical protein